MTLILALILDAIFGEPRALWDRFPHPAVLMGRAVGVMDQRFNHGPNQISKMVIDRQANEIGTRIGINKGAALCGF